MCKVSHLMNHFIDSGWAYNFLFNCVLCVLLVPLCKEIFQMEDHSWLEQLEDNGFRLGTKNMEYLIGVSSRSRINCPYTSPVSIPTIQPASDINSIKKCLAWQANFFKEILACERELDGGHLTISWWSA